MTSGPGPREFLGFWAQWSSPIPQKGPGSNNSKSKTEITDALLRNKGG